MTESWVDMDAIKQQVTLDRLLAHYGLAGKRAGREVTLTCPFHDDTHPSLSANLEKGVWQCFGCGLSGDMLAFVVKYNGIDTGERHGDRLAAARFLAETFSVATSDPPTHRSTLASPPATSAESENVPLTFTLHPLDAAHPYLRHDRGLRPDTIRHFGIGFYSGKGMMQGRVVIPIHDAHGRLVAYAGRWPGDPPPDTPKYRFPRHFRKSLVVFNLHRALAHASDGLAVVEGFFTVFDLWQKGRPNVVAIMGSSLSSAQAQRLVATVGSRGRLLLAFDPDEAGRKGAADAVTRLVPHVFVRTTELA
jgi:DNA primase